MQDKMNVVDAIAAIESATSFGAILKILGSMKGAKQKTDSEIKAGEAYGLQSRGQVYRKNINSQAKEILERVADSSELTDEDKAVLMQYSGRGGLKLEGKDLEEAGAAQVYEYYTPPEIAQGAWDLLAANGFENGSVLEPSCGAGVFLGTSPESVKMTGVELDKTSSGVAGLLNPSATVSNQAFEQLCARSEDNSFDAVIGNVPFSNSGRGATAVLDPQYQDIKQMERYFVTRAIDKVKHGGLVCLLTPTNITDDKSGTFVKWRNAISKKAEFLGAHKLPNSVFGGANGNGADVATALVVFQKHSKKLTDKIQDSALSDLTSANVLWPVWISGEWFKKDGKRFVIGTESAAGWGGRVKLESDLDKSAIKKLVARKFNSRIDFAALDAAPTLVKNYAEGDRREIGMVMHEMVSGEWLKVDTGIDSKGELDSKRYGARTINDYVAAISSPLQALSLNFEQAKEGVNGQFSSRANEAVRQAVAVAAGQPQDMQERTYRAALLGCEIQRYSIDLTGGKDIAGERLESLQALITAEVDKYGNPSKDKNLSKIRGGGAAAIGAFRASVKQDGAYSDLLMGKIDRSAADNFDSDDATDVVRYLSSRANNPIDIEEFAENYSGKPLAIEDFASFDQVAITENGELENMERYCSGNVAQKQEALRNIIASTSNPAMIAKFTSQIDAMESVRTFVKLEDISVSLRSKWLDKDLLAQFITEKGYGVNIDGDDGSFYYTDNRKLTGFDNQLLHYLNGRGVRGKKEAQEEYNQQIKDFEEQLSVWLQQHENADLIERSYNDKFNGFVPLEYSSDDLALDNVSGEVKPHWYQASAVRRMSDEGRGILGFDVGLGKTFSALAFAQYHKQMGRAKRTAIVVPKSVLENWYHETRSFHSSMSHVHFVGFTPTGESEPVIDEQGNGKINKRTGLPEMRDQLKEDSASKLIEKLQQIPQISQSLVVMSKESFARIPLQLDSRQEYAERMVSKNLMRDADLRALAAESSGKKQGQYDTAKKQLSYESKFSDGGTTKSEEIPYFEEMGFDSVIVDEGHNYKNTYTPSSETARLAFLPTSSNSAAVAVDMAVKMDYLRGRNNGNGSYMLTATPVTNSPIEIYNMLSHIASSEEFERMGIINVDDFVREFCETETVQRVKLSGEIVSELGVSGFRNLESLRSLFGRFVNLKKAADVNDAENSLKMPDAIEIDSHVDMLQIQSEIYEELREEASRIGQEPTFAIDDEGGVGIAEESRPVFAIIRDMDRVTTDLDLYLRSMTFTIPSKYDKQLEKLIADLPRSITKTLSAEDDSGEKVKVEVSLNEKYQLILDSNGISTLVVDELYENDVVKRLKKFGIEQKDVAHPIMPKYAKMLENLRNSYESGGKQIIFTEEKTQHNKILRLIVHHLPIEASEIGIINSETSGGGKLERTSAAYNSGSIKIIIANKKAEVGVNLQRGTTDIHHLTLPWTPASIQQRNGRGVRQGNTVSGVNVHYYLGKGSFDEYRLGTLKRKADWINELLTGTANTSKNADADQSEEYAAMLASNPQERLRVIAEQKASKSKAVRDKANKKATIDLENLRRSKLFLKEFDARLAASISRAKENGRDPIKAEEILQIKKEKAKKDILQIEDRLITAQEKGRIDTDAKSLIKSGEYLTTLRGEIIEAGNYFEDSSGNLVRVKLVDVGSSVMIYNRVRPGGSFGMDKTESAANFKFKLLKISGEDLEIELIKRKLFGDYNKLTNSSITSEWLAENTQFIIDGNLIEGEMIARGLDGKMLAGSSYDLKNASGIKIEFPRPSNEAWRSEALEFFYKENKKPDKSYSILRFAESLLGSDWVNEASGMYGSRATDAEIIAIIQSEIPAIYEEFVEIINSATGWALNAKSLSEFDERVRPANDSSVAVKVSLSLSSRVSKAIGDLGFDNNDRLEIQGIVKSLRVAESVQKMVNSYLEVQRIKVKEVADIDLLEREKAIKKVNDLMPEGVVDFFASKNIKVQFNKMDIIWQSMAGTKKAARAKLPYHDSKVAERFMMFDEDGYNGLLAKKAKGKSSPLQEMFGATYSMFGGSLWWHIDAKDIDFEKLMEIFK